MIAAHLHLVAVCAMLSSTACRQPTGDLGNVDPVVARARSQREIDVVFTNTSRADAYLNHCGNEPLAHLERRLGERWVLVPPVPCLAVLLEPERIAPGRAVSFTMTSTNEKTPGSDFVGTFRVEVPSYSSAAAAKSRDS